MLSRWSVFITKIRSAIKILKNQGDVFCFCHKRMQWTALGAKNQITIDIDNPSVRLNTGVCFGQFLSTFAADEKENLVIIWRVREKVVNLRGEFEQNKLKNCDIFAYVAVFLYLCGVF